MIIIGETIVEEEETFTMALSEIIRLSAAQNTIIRAGVSATATIENDDIWPPFVTVDVLVTSDRAPPLSGTVSDSEVSVEVSLAGQSYVATKLGGSAWVLADDTINPPLSDGTIDVIVTSVNQAGKVGTVQTLDELTIDATPPAVMVNTLMCDDGQPPVTPRPLRGLPQQAGRNINAGKAVPSHGLVHVGNRPSFSPLRSQRTRDTAARIWECAATG